MAEFCCLCQSVVVVTLWYSPGLKPRPPYCDKYLYRHYTNHCTMGMSGSSCRVFITRTRGNVTRPLRRCNVMKQFCLSSVTYLHVLFSTSIEKLKDISPLPPLLSHLRSMTFSRDWISPRCSTRWWHWPKPPRVSGLTGVFLGWFMEGFLFSIQIHTCEVPHVTCSVDIRVGVVC